MFRFENKPISSNIARFKIYIEKTENYDIAGILYNSTYGIAIDFLGIRQMLSCLDEFFDYVNFPQATHEKRSFIEELDKKEKYPPRWLRVVVPEEMQDKQPIFLLHVQFRQNATWQGTLELISEGKTERFRSELEMIELIAGTLKKIKI